MQSNCSKISDSELEVMKILWQSKTSLSLTQIRLALTSTSEWDSSTIKTLVRRLCEKEVLTIEKREVFYYMPLITEADYHAYSTQSLLDKLFGGSAKKLIATLVDSKQIDRADLEELQKVLEPSKGADQ